MAIIKSAVSSIVSFCLKVIALFLTNPSKCFLYIFVPLNQTSNLFDPLTKQTEAKRRKGVVGKSGRIIPMIPRNMNKKPSAIYTTFLIFFILSTLLIYLQYTYHSMVCVV